MIVSPESSNLKVEYLQLASQNTTINYFSCPMILSIRFKINLRISPIQQDSIHINLALL